MKRERVPQTHTSVFVEAVITRPLLEGILREVGTATLPTLIRYSRGRRRRRGGGSLLPHRLLRISGDHLRSKTSDLRLSR